MTHLWWQLANPLLCQAAQTRVHEIGAWHTLDCTKGCGTTSKPDCSSQRCCKHHFTSSETMKAILERRSTEGVAGPENNIEHRPGKTHNPTPSQPGTHACDMVSLRRHTDAHASTPFNSQLCKGDCVAGRPPRRWHLLRQILTGHLPHWWRGAPTATQLARGGSDRRSTLQRLPQHSRGQCATPAVGG